MPFCEGKRAFSGVSDAFSFGKHFMAFARERLFTTSSFTFVFVFYAGKVLVRLDMSDGYDIRLFGDPQKTSWTAKAKFTRRLAESS
jgi:hypothetical protein